MGQELKSVTIRRRRYRVLWRNLKGLWGSCEKGKITFHNELRDNDGALLNVAIHEAIHAYWRDYEDGPSLEESTVDEMANNIANFILRLGYRRDHDD